MDYNAKKMQTRWRTIYGLVWGSVFQSRLNGTLCGTNSEAITVCLHGPIRYDHIEKHNNQKFMQPQETAWDESMPADNELNSSWWK